MTAMAIIVERSIATSGVEGAYQGGGGRAARPDLGAVYSQIYSPRCSLQFPMQAGGSLVGNTVTPRALSILWHCCGDNQFAAAEWVGFGAKERNQKDSKCQKPSDDPNLGE